LANAHIIAPHYDATSRHRLRYLSNSTGAFASSFLTDTLDSAALDCDIASNGSSRVVVSYTVYKPKGPPVTTFPKVGLIELAPQTDLSWQAAQAIDNLNPILPPKYPFWKSGIQ